MWKSLPRCAEVFFVPLNFLGNNSVVDDPLGRLSAPRGQSDYSLDEMAKWSISGRPNFPPFSVDRGFFSLESIKALEQSMAIAANHIGQNMVNIQPHVCIISHRFRNTLTKVEVLVPSHVATIFRINDVLIVGPCFVSVGHAVAEAQGGLELKQQVIGHLMRGVVRDDVFKKLLKSEFGVRELLICISVPYQKLDRLGLAGSALHALGAHTFFRTVKGGDGIERKNTLYLFTDHPDYSSLLKPELVFLMQAFEDAWLANFSRLSAARTGKSNSSEWHYRQQGVDFLLNAEYPVLEDFQLLDPNLPPNPSVAPREVLELLSVL